MSQALACRAFAPLSCRTTLPAELHHAEIFPTAAGLTGRFNGVERRYAMAGDPFGAAFDAVRDVFAQFAATASGDGAYHGATVAIAGAGTVLLGDATAGKTLLALHLTAMGGCFYGDETFLFDGENRVVRAMPRLPALREPALALLPDQAMRRAVEGALNVAARPGGRLYYALEPHELCGIAPDPSPLPLKNVILLHGRARHTRLERLTVNGLLAAFVRRSYVKPADLRALGRIRAALHGVRGYRLIAGAPAQTAQLIVKELTRCT
ncbi:MAG: hypothetical protein ABR508_06215 [Candidatus Baltobacteraceae bacterium]